MMGLIEDIGIFPGSGKLDGDGEMLQILGFPGIEKSSISLLNTIPVLEPYTSDPKLW